MWVMQIFVRINGPPNRTESVRYRFYTNPLHSSSTPPKTTQQNSCRLPLSPPVSMPAVSPKSKKSKSKPGGRKTVAKAPKPPKGKPGRRSWAKGEMAKTMEGYLTIYKNEVRGKLEQSGVTAFYDRTTSDFLEKFGWDVPNVTHRIPESVEGNGPPVTNGKSSRYS